MNLSEFFGQILGMASQGIGGDVYRQLEPWFREIGKRAVPRWGRVLIADLRCQVTRGCTERAISLCEVCERAACLAHCRPSYTADVNCEHCVFEMTKKKGRLRPRRPPPPPPPGAIAERIAALRELGLGITATPEEVHARFRELARKLHPDRHQQKSPAERQRMEQRFARISAAYTLLQPRTEARAS